MVLAIYMGLMTHPDATKRNRWWHTRALKPIWWATLNSTLDPRGACIYTGNMHVIRCNARCNANVLPKSYFAKYCLELSLCPLFLKPRLPVKRQ